MLRRLLLPLLLVLGFAARAQQQYRVDDFSPLYYASIYLAQPQEVFSPGWIAVFDKKTGRQLLKVESEELAVTRHAGQPKSNVQQLPYGEQSAIISADFNFDGRPDLAIMDGQNSCYHGPSYQVFLATAAGLRADAAFTRLAQEYCGMFQVDAQRKRLTTSGKDGCCWHETSTFEVRGGVPFLVYRHEDDLGRPPFRTTTEQRWNGQKLVRTETRALAFLGGNVQVICAFQVAGSQKRVMLLRADGVLYYALLKDGTAVEFSYPESSGAAARAFTLQQAGPELRLQFQNGAARYEIRESATGQLSVTAQAGAKMRTLTSAATGKQGSLRPLLTAKLENLTVQP